MSLKTSYTGPYSNSEMHCNSITALNVYGQELNTQVPPNTASSISFSVLRAEF